MKLSRLLAALASHSRRRAPVVLLAGILLAFLAGWLGATRIGVSTDTDTLFSASLPWRQRQIAWDAAFPQFRNLLVAVIDADEPEEAEASAADLAKALAADKAQFASVTRPDASPYLERNGLLFLDPEDPGVAARPHHRCTTLPWPAGRGPQRARPVRGAEPAGDGGGAGGRRSRVLCAGAAGLSPVACRCRGGSSGAAVVGESVGRAGCRTGWQIPLRAGPGPPRFHRAAAGAAATQVLRDAISRLEFVRSGAAHVRVTGSVALADEEFATVAQGIVAGTVASVLLIALWLLLAVRSWRLIVPILLTLLLGLSLTVGFAALAVGTLNLVSVAFAILFVGIAVDFAIQFTVRFRQAMLTEGEAGAALDSTAYHVGPEVLVAAAATASGFLAFVPTSFAGVAELGLIAGVGMVIAFLCTILFLPAALTVFRPQPERRPIGLRGGEAMERSLVKARRPVLAGVAVLAIAGVALIPRVGFDSDPLHTKDPNTEAMRTLADLLASPLTDPYTRRHPRTHADGCRRACRAAGQAAVGIAGAHALQLRAAGPAAEARADRRRRQYPQRDLGAAFAAGAGHAGRPAAGGAEHIGADPARAAEAGEGRSVAGHRGRPSQAGRRARRDADGGQRGAHTVPAVADRPATPGA